MLRPASLVRPRAALALAATAAAALTAACDDGPLGPNTSARPAAVGAAPRAGAHLPVPALIRATFVVSSNTNMKYLVPGTAVRFTHDKGSVLVTDNVGGPEYVGDADPEAGRYSVYLPFGSTHYKAEVVSVPVGYQMPTSAAYGKVTGSGGDMTVAFPTAYAPPKKQLVINFFSMQKVRAPGASVAVTSPGMDLLYQITDGGAGDLLADGSQGPADGQVTVYSPSWSILKWQMCETAAPAGYLTTDPACRTVDLAAAAAVTPVSLFHLTGPFAPPPSM